MAERVTAPDGPAPALAQKVEARFLAALERIAVGYGQGVYAGRRWGVTLTRSPDGRRRWLYGEELGGTGRVSFNLYMLGGGPVLRPCEMPAGTVIGFVLAYRPDPVRGSAASRTPTASPQARPC